ncbi:hypothetical protein JXQ31_08285 [candidate division KSB1 bacterium]|nr:hypothetical protein [candidate division KSB1 bacterium]
MKKNVIMILLGLSILVCACTSSLVILNENIIQQYGITDDDLEKYIYRTNGEVIFYRIADGFDSSRRSASEGAIRKRAVTNQFYERVVLKHNTDGFFHHRTDTHIYIQMKSGDYIFPFKLSTGQLDAPTIVVDGKQYDYEEGEATLLFFLKKRVER